MNRNSSLLGIIAVIFITSCSSQVYNNSDYLKANQIEGKKVAILPVAMEFTGRLPKGYTQEEKQEDEVAESISTQHQVFSQYLYNSAKSKKKQQVTLISPDHVNSVLRSKGIGIRESWKLNPDSLGKLVGADLVLKVRIRKDRIMSNEAALGVDVAGSILSGVLGRGNGVGNVASGNSKTYRINFDATLSDVENHVIITRFSKENSADWNTSPENIIKSTSATVVRRGVVYAEK